MIPEVCLPLSSQHCNHIRQQYVSFYSHHRYLIYLRLPLSCILALLYSLTYSIFFVRAIVNGTTFECEGFQSMIAEVKVGNVSAVIVKDMNRLGHDYLKVSFYTEVMFKEKSVRLIDINNGIDSANQQDSDFTSFLNNEWYARDAIRKIQAVFKSRMQDGKRISPNIPYGYLRSLEDKQKLKKIFRMPSITDLYHPNSRGSKGAETAAFRNDNINRGNQQKAITLV